MDREIIFETLYSKPGGLYLNAICVTLPALPASLFRAPVPGDILLEILSNLSSIKTPNRPPIV